MSRYASRSSDGRRWKKNNKIKAPCTKDSTRHVLQEQWQPTKQGRHLKNQVANARWLQTRTHTGTRHAYCFTETHMNMCYTNTLTYNLAPALCTLSLQLTAWCHVYLNDTKDFQHLFKTTLLRLMLHSEKKNVEGAFSYSEVTMTGTSSQNT